MPRKIKAPSTFISIDASTQSMAYAVIKDGKVLKFGKIEYEGKTLRVLVDGETGRDEYNLSSRTNGGRLVHLKGESSLIGKFIDVKITASNTWALYGEIV